MKHLLFIIFILISVKDFSQKKDTIQYDTTTVLSFTEMQQIVNYMQIQSSGKVDVKPETWNELIALLYKKTSLTPKQKTK